MSLDIWYAAARCKVAKEQFERDLAAAQRTWNREIHGGRGDRVTQPDRAGRECVQRSGQAPHLFTERAGNAAGDSSPAIQHQLLRGVADVLSLVGRRKFSIEE